MNFLNSYKKISKNGKQNPFHLPGKLMFSLVLYRVKDVFLPALTLCGFSKSSQWCFKYAQHKSPTWLLGQYFVLKIVCNIHSWSLTGKKCQFFTTFKTDASTMCNRNYQVFIKRFGFCGSVSC